MALSARGNRALAILRDGGKFRKQLESGYRGREQFQMRLYYSDGVRVAGIGFATKFELEEAGLLRYQHPHDARSSAWPEEWIAAPADAVSVSSEFKIPPPGIVPRLGNVLDEHLYEIDVSGGYSVKVDAKNRTQAAAIAEREGYRVCSVNMIG